MALAETTPQEQQDSHEESLVRRVALGAFVVAAALLAVTSIEVVDDHYGIATELTAVAVAGLLGAKLLQKGKND